ncbi:carbon-nitrogen hydrolase family protein [Pelagibius sp. CAU 1746]|uniref:carbon-nitrogen hydrolase family protein n=1 Tax=Pelagibius sp. CAU 1746 TaxID=3140370 RepID=UPI00325B911A
MKAALLQMQAATGAVEANLQTIEEAAAQAAAQGAELLIAPELATTGYGAGEAIRDLAEPAAGPQVARLASIAARHGLAVAAGFAERDGDDVFNSLAMAAPGLAPAVYRKTHLYGDYERALFTPGEVRPAIADWGGLKLGFLICYDVEFPENVRRLAEAGAEVIVVPTALPEGPYAGFIATQVVPVRAFENQIFVIYANHAGRDARFGYAGLSCIAAPDGRCLAASDGNEPALLFAEIDPAAYEESRRANSYLADLRRP